MDFSQSYWHLLIFTVLFLAGLVLVVWQAGEEASRTALANGVIQEMSAVVVVSAAVAILSVDGAKMFAESFLEKRYQDGRKDVLKDLVKRRIITEEQRKEFEGLKRESK